MPKDLPEHERARQWRKAIGLTVAELSERTGFSVSSIQDFEAGARRPTGAKLDPRAVLRYRLACAAINANADGFDWR